MNDMCIVQAPHPIGGLPAEEVRAKADKVFPEIVSVAEHWTPKARSSDSGQRKPYPATRFTVKGGEDEIAAYLLGRKWTDGLPVVPPTPARVEAMLKGTSLSPDTVIGEVPPRNGVLTVELAAVYSVMAGCKPEYLPVVIAACQALLDPMHEFREATTTTNQCGMLILVSGPIVKELGIRTGSGLFGPEPGNTANATIGRAVNMITDILGGSTPAPAGKDGSQFGLPGSYTMCAGEDADLNPWGRTIAVQQGFTNDDNIVTVFETRSYINLNLHHNNNAEDLLHSMALTMAMTTGIGESGYGCTDAYKELLILGPEHTDTIVKDGWDFDKVSRYLWETARVDAGDYFIRNGRKPPLCRADDPNPTVLKSPDNLLIMVGGGKGKHSMYLETTRYAPVSKKIVR